MFLPNIYNHPPQDWSNSSLHSSLSGVQFVNGIDEVNSLSVPFGLSALFMDKNKDTFYIKRVDNAGITSVEEYEFQRVMPPAPPEYVTKDDFNKFAEQILSKIGDANESTISTTEQPANQGATQLYENNNTAVCQAASGTASI